MVTDVPVVFPHDTITMNDYVPLGVHKISTMNESKVER